MTKDEAREILETQDGMVLRGVVAIFEKQTALEQGTAMTIENNGVGFNGFDANIMTSFARQINKRGTLTQKQFVVAKKIIMKYAGQLARIANKEI